MLVLTAFDGADAVKEVFCPAAQLQLIGAQYGISKYSYTELEQKTLNAVDDVAQIKEAYDNGGLKGDKGNKGDKGDQGEKGEKGDSYILTEADKTEIAGKVPTHEKYFDITTEGIISLKSVYRGAANFKVTDNDVTVPSNQIPYAISNNGEGKIGDKYYELPEEIIIPKTVNGITVTGYAQSIFAYNNRIKRVILNPNVTSLPIAFLYRAANCEEVKNTEHITEIKNMALKGTKIKKIKMPNLVTMKSGALAQCERLEFVDIGKVEELPNQAFTACHTKSLYPTYRNVG